jgi:hypothetical protein
MRVAQKRDIQDLINTLNEAHGEIKSNIERNIYQAAQDMLVQCQEGAINIGNTIEAFEGEGFVTVSYIEDYCDLVYKTYESLNSSEEINPNKIYKNLNRQLLRIENSVKNDIKIRKEVVFLPYKASMWDSLESIYLAAKEDEDCDAYCVPIPYFDLNPDRTLGEMHYEGDQYPKNIEVIDWQTYNFEERNPDEIYIHNPYDNWNLVTSVHPRFYSKNLKEHTEKLVYVPYFVLNEIEPDNQQAIDGMKHFIWTPGVINADKVIVQSEKMKQIYVNEYLKAAKENGLGGKHLDRKYLEEKILGLGSPKFDKVNNTKKEDLEIPEEWLKVIEKPDGSWKKIIFYNTSVGALLSNNEKMLDKMRYVFGIFKENKEEVALLWRPHPLIENTIKSMRPQLWLQYKALVDEYKQEGWGIYDDTADMDRAVILSDGYYGDGSSVVQVYQQTGKPVMIQGVELVNNPNNIDNIYLNFRSYVRTKDSLLFANMEFNGLFSMSLETFEIKQIHTFGQAAINQFFCVRQCVVKHKDNILFLMNNTAQGRICFLNLKTNQEKLIDLPGLFKSSTDGCGVFEADNKGWFVPTDLSNGIYVINFDTLDIEKEKKLSTLLEGYKWGMRCVKQGKDSFSFIDMNKNEMVLVNVVSKTIKILKIPVKNANGFAIVGDVIWLTCMNDTNVYEWNVRNKIVNTFILEDVDQLGDFETPYSNLIFVEEQDSLFLLGGELNAIYKTDRNKHSIYIAFPFPKNFQFINNTLRYYGYHFAEVERVEDELWFYPIIGNMILIYNIRENSVIGINSYITKKKLHNFEDILIHELHSVNCLEGEGLYSLYNMLDVIVNKKIN